MKIIDFGSAAKISDNDNRLSQSLNDPYFRSPEMIAGDYGSKCDIWALGALTYILITGVPPFCGATEEIILDKIKN